MPEIQIMTPPHNRELWERWPREPGKWFHFFDSYYRSLGPERTIEEAYRQWRKLEAPHRQASRPSNSWRQHAKQWRWEERAEAWDEQRRHDKYVAQEKAREEAGEAIISALQELYNVGKAIIKPQRELIMQGLAPDMSPLEFKHTVEGVGRICQELRLAYGLMPPAEHEHHHRFPDGKPTFGVLVVQSPIESDEEWEQCVKAYQISSDSRALPGDGGNGDMVIDLEPGNGNGQE